MSYVIEMLEAGIRPNTGEYFYEVYRARRDNDNELTEALARHAHLFKDKAPYTGILVAAYLEKKKT